MSPFLMHSRTAWSDYFTGITLQSNEYGTSQTHSATCVYVSNCLFRSIMSTNHGGALSCISVTILLIESSSFFSCKTSSSDGGAIYFFNNNNGQCVLYEVCGFDCISTFTSSTSYGQFARVDVSNGALSKNYINYSSIVRCVNENSNSQYTLCQQYGKNCYPSLNISMNKCYGRAGIYCYPYGDSNYNTRLLSFSSFADNHATGYTCISLNIASAMFEIKCCNILRNTQGSPGIEGTIILNGNMNIEDSCILGNKATYIFYQTSSSSAITLSNCTVDSTSKYGSLTIQNTVTKSFILALNHMSTHYCEAEYDSTGTLTSSPKKKMYHCTCGNLLYHLSQRKFVLLVCVFIFNFIHPYASYLLGY
jgi:hypothetical protein